MRNVGFTLRSIACICTKTLPYTFTLLLAPNNPVRQINPFCRWGSTVHKANKEKSWDLMPGFLVLSLGPFLCPHRILLGLPFGVTVTPYSRLPASAGYTQGRSCHTGWSFCSINSRPATQEELDGEEPRGSPTFLRDHLVVKRKNPELGGDTFALETHWHK